MNNSLAGLPVLVSFSPTFNTSPQLFLPRLTMHSLFVLATLLCLSFVHAQPNPAIPVTIGSGCQELSISPPSGTIPTDTDFQVLLSFSEDAEYALFLCAFLFRPQVRWSEFLRI
jgi:hypothetical protein